MCWLDKTDASWRRYRNWDSWLLKSSQQQGMNETHTHKTENTTHNKEKLREGEPFWLFCTCMVYIYLDFKACFIGRLPTTKCSHGGIHVVGFVWELPNVKHVWQFNRTLWCRLRLVLIVPLFMIHYCFIIINNNYSLFHCSFMTNSGICGALTLSCMRCSHDCLDRIIVTNSKESSVPLGSRVFSTRLVVEKTRNFKKKRQGFWGLEHTNKIITIRGET
jgi:hypothetical protein